MWNDIIFWYLIGCLISFCIIYFINSYGLSDESITLSGFFLMTITSWFTIILFISGIIAGIFKFFKEK